MAFVVVGICVCGCTSEQQTYVLNVTVEPSGAGSVTLSPGGGQYVAGTRVTLQATPSAGYEFESYGGDLTGTASVAELVINADVTVIARFHAGAGRTTVPVANAGPDQVVDEGDTVRLAGSGTVADGKAMTFRWVQLGTPVVTLSDSRVADPTFTAPESTADFELLFQLRVSDGANTTTDTMTVSVAADNDLPVVDAGPDQTVEEGDSAQLAGRTTDPEQQAVTVEWVQIAGPPVALSEVTSLRPTFAAPEAAADAEIRLELRASDGQTTGVDEVTVLLKADNDPPVVDAGEDQSVAETTSVALSGAATDPDSRNLDVEWVQTAGPVVTLSDSQGLHPTFTAPKVPSDSAMVFELRVSDEKTTSADSLTVIVIAGNDPPAVNAGPDQVIGERTLVQLTGTATDPESQPLTWQWMQTDGPAVTLSDAAIADPTFTAPRVQIDRDLVFELRVSDGQYTTTDTVTITVVGGWSQYGGWKQIRTSATGFFRTEQVNGKWWLIDPEGYAFISKGVSHIGYFGEYCPALGYSPYAKATEAKYGTIEKFAWAAVGRLQDWGFNTVGAWSDTETFTRGMPYTVILSLADSAGGTWYADTFADPFSDAFAADVEALAEAQCSPRINDPWLVGYFLDNELYWGPDWRAQHTLLEKFLTLVADAPGKIAAIDFLLARYGDMAALNQAWGTQYADRQDMLESTEPPTFNEAATVDAAGFLRIVLQQYFSVCGQAVHKVDPNHLNLGCRFVGPAPDQVLQAYGLSTEQIGLINAFWYSADGQTELLEGTRGGVDVISMNVYLDALPADLMNEIHQHANAPLLISEFGFKAMDSGLPNTRGAGLPLATQADRASHFTDYVHALIDSPYSVGYHWFEHTDEPALGRFDGEDCNYGVVDVNDNPWEILVTQMTAVNNTIESRHAAP